jgi:hypothetical protein
VKRRWKVYFFPALLIVALAGSYHAAGAADEKWKMVISLKGQWKFNIGDNKKWAEPKYNDREWESIRVPAKWEDEGFYGYNGYAWYRTTFEGSTLENRSWVFNLFLGYIDDADEVYFNGHKIGSSGSFPPKYHTAYNAFRNYTIPSEYINFQGKNVVAVRIYDSEIEGGIVSGDVGIYTNDEDKALAVNLRGVWDFTLAEGHFKRPPNGNHSAGGKQTPPVKAAWSRISVPGTWENQGYEYDGGAWYRKQFMVPKSLAGEDLMLLLGKIDDYDQVYLNGKLVGATNDWQRQRVYTIQPEMITAGAVNILMIYVFDEVGLGGIYQGPLGLIKQSDFTRYVRWKR